jgi:short-subunit dehydrogenase
VSGSEVQTVWLTGASSGIGLAVLERLVAEGHKVIATGRRADALERLVQRHPEQVVALPADTTSKTDMAQAGKLLVEHQVTWAILNAGTCEYLDTRDFSADLVERVVTTNVVGTARSVEAVLPALRNSRLESRPVRLAIVGSSARWFPFTRAEAYGASKAALAYFARSLRADLAQEGILITLISPGFVKTPLTDRNDFHMPFMVSAEMAADEIVTGLNRGKSEIEFPKRFTVSLKLLGMLPQRFIDWIAVKLARSQVRSEPHHRNGV